MNTAADDSNATDHSHAQSDWARALRYLCRTPVLVVHLFVILPLALLVISPMGARVSFRGERMDHRMTRWWSSGLVRCFGFRIRRFGEPLPGSVLFVANHLSWLDIELMHSQTFMCFVAKAEIERWPLVGWLAGRAGTIYHRRGSTHSLGAVMERVVERLKTGLPVGVFPEGGTGDGSHVRTFHARIFQVAADANVPIQPVALRYGNDQRQDPAVAFANGESFFGNFVRLLGNPSVRAEVHFCAPVPHSEDGRRRTAEAARASIVAALGLAE